MFHPKKINAKKSIWNNLLGTLLNDIFTYYLQILSIWHQSPNCDRGRRFWPCLLKRGMWWCSQIKRLTAHRKWLCTVINNNNNNLTIRFYITLTKVSKLIYINYKMFRFPSCFVFSKPSRKWQLFLYIYSHACLFVSVYEHRWNTRVLIDAHCLIFVFTLQLKH